ncbi:MAG: sugar O-acetyltransferase [Oscillospiraceae bacterium]
MDNITRRDNELPYKGDEACYKQMIETRRKIYEYNNTFEPERLSEQLKNILGKYGENCTILPPFHCDYGFNISVGENFFANYDLTILDVGKVNIGENVMMGPGVSIYTAGHPVHYEARNTMYEYGIAVTIGDNCWIGGKAVICPGVTIGSGSVIGAGSVVTKDIPDNVIAAGNPCRVIRSITDEDKRYYFRDREFDDEAMREVFGNK